MLLTALLWSVFLEISVCVWPTYSWTWIIKHKQIPYLYIRVSMCVCVCGWLKADTTSKVMYLSSGSSYWLDFVCLSINVDFQSFKQIAQNAKNWTQMQNKNHQKFGFYSNLLQMVQKIVCIDVVYYVCMYVCTDSCTIYFLLFMCGN